MSFSDNKKKWGKVCRNRLILNRICSFGIMVSLSLSTFFFLLFYNYNLYIIIPFIIFYFTIGYLGVSYFVGMWFGLYAALLPLGKDKYNPIHNACDINKTTKIAIIIPIYNEDIRRICAAISAMVEDMKVYDEKEHFDFFVLSDSRCIDLVSQEMFAIEKMKELYPDTVFVYRRRKHNSDAKLGNISDFIRRYSPEYKYMMMLDADSIVPAKSMLIMTKVMEGNDNIGILQSYLNIVMRKTVYARISKFINSFTSKILFYAQNFFFMGRSYYYGHNAIIRTKAFAEHCNLPILREKGPWSGGRPLSHDYIEAALLDGAGYEIWSLPQIESFEELPTNFIDDFRREMRWMYGNMNFLRVLLFKKIHFLYKVRLFFGAFNYFNSIFGWLFFLLSSSGLIYVLDHPIKSYFFMKMFSPIIIFSLFFLLFSIVAKWGISTLYFYKKRKTHLFGGFAKMTISYCVYAIYAMLIAPMYMCQLTKMLLFWILGKKIHWGTQNRRDRCLSWSEVLSQTAWMSVVGSIISYIIVTQVFPHDTVEVQRVLHITKFSLIIWFFPIIGGMIVSPVLVRITSMESSILQRIGWFLSPQEVEPHFVIKRTEELLPYFQEIIPESMTFYDVVRSPWFFFKRLDQLPRRPQKTVFWKEKLMEKSLVDCTDGEKFVILQTYELWEMFHLRELHLIA